MHGDCSLNTCAPNMCRLHEFIMVEMSAEQLWADQWVDNMATFTTRSCLTTHAVADISANCVHQLQHKKEIIYV